MLGGVVAIGRLPSSLAAQDAPPRGTAPASLSLLVLGGTGFIGPHLVRHAVARGHRVTIFTRGRRTADLPASVTRLVGDRSGQLHALKGGLADTKDASETFGVNKALCERQAQRVFGDRATVLRPTYIVGPGDTTDRFPYWPVRLARGGEVLAPGKRDDRVAFIDVRDLAEFMVKLVEERRAGVYKR
jgi:2'-hydroxyisoflavone reductase